MFTDINTNSIVWAGENAWFISKTANIVQPDLTKALPKPVENVILDKEIPVFIEMQCLLSCVKAASTFFFIMWMDNFVDISACNINPGSMNMGFVLIKRWMCQLRF